VRLVLLLALVLTGGCKKKVEREREPAPAPVAEAPDADTREDDQYRAEAEAAYDNITAGAVPGEQLDGFAPAMLGGVARTNTLPQAFAIAAAYRLDGDAYANLDIKNTFRRGGLTAEDHAMSSCARKEQVAGHVACVRLTADRASFHWDLPDRLTVDLSAPDEALARKMAQDLPLAEIAALSARR
jgi:hypothetical protein